MCTRMSEREIEGGSATLQVKGEFVGRWTRCLPMAAGEMHGCQDQQSRAPLTRRHEHLAREGMSITVLFTDGVPH